MLFNLFDFICFSGMEKSNSMAKIFRDVMYSLGAKYHHLAEPAASISRVNEGSMFPQNIGTYLPNYAV
jgi:hypothetical protein